MASIKQCAKCGAAIPDFARIWWKCGICSYQNAINQPTFSELCVKNAGTLVLSGLVVGFVPSALNQAGAGLHPVFFIPSAIVLVCGIFGYVRRGGQKRR